MVAFGHAGRPGRGSRVQPGGGRDVPVALAQVRLGAGNNGQDGTEGARQHNVIGSYLHGSLLPKNPQLADWLIAEAVKRACGTFTPSDIDDHLAEQAREIALKLGR